MNCNIVKKITLMDLVMALGIVLMVIGLGIKMREANAENNVAGEVKKGEPVKIIININTASLTELDVLPSIGPVTAQKIIDYRNKWGVFKNKEEIKKVSGIGEKTYEKIMDKIEI